MMMRLVNMWIPVFVWAGIIFFFSSLRIEKSSEFSLHDFMFKKTLHFIEYFVLFVLLYRAIKPIYALNIKRAGFVAFLISFIYAISDEYHQSFTPGRGPSFRDVMIDATGAITSWIIIRKLLPKTQGKLKSLVEKLELL